MYPTLYWPSLNYSSPCVRIVGWLSIWTSFNGKHKYDVINNGSNNSFINIVFWNIDQYKIFEYAIVHNHVFNNSMSAKANHDRNCW